MRDIRFQSAVFARPGTRRPFTKKHGPTSKFHRTFLSANAFSNCDKTVGRIILRRRVTLTPTKGLDTLPKGNQDGYVGRRVGAADAERCADVEDLVELIGIEPMASSLRTTRSPS